jgi:hypothetical protein
MFPKLNVLPTAIIHLLGVATGADDLAQVSRSLPNRARPGETLDSLAYMPCSTSNSRDRFGTLRKSSQRRCELGLTQKSRHFSTDTGDIANDIAHLLDDRGNLLDALTNHFCRGDSALTHRFGGIHDALSYVFGDSSESFETEHPLIIV